MKACAMSPKTHVSQRHLQNVGTESLKHQIKRLSYEKVTIQKLAFESAISLSTTPFGTLGSMELLRHSGNSECATMTDFWTREF